MKKNPVGAPRKNANVKKQSMTVSINPSVNTKIIKAFGSRGFALELAAKHAKAILDLEKQ